MTQHVATGSSESSLSEDLSPAVGSGSLSFSNAPVRRQKHNFSGYLMGGRYELDGQLGRGGMATVYRAIDRKLSKPVAVKILNPEHNQAYARRLTEEARAVSQLRHDHIVSVSDVDFDNEHNLAYFVMELCEGKDLGSVLWEQGPLKWAEVVEIAMQICGALTEAHARGVIHRDIKPANCMLLSGPGIDVRVLDFGIAKFTERYFEHPEVVWPVPAHDVPTIGMVGTPGYVAPEQLERSADDPRVDVYGLGAMMYRLLTNKMPKPWTEGQQMPEPLARAVSDGVPEGLADVLLRTLAADPERRYASAEELRSTLAEFVHPASSIVHVASGPAPVITRVLAVIVILLFVVFLAQSLMGDDPTSVAVTPPQSEMEIPVRTRTVLPVEVSERIGEQPDQTTGAIDDDAVIPDLPVEPAPAIADDVPTPKSPVTAVPKKRKLTELRGLERNVQKCYRAATGGLSHSSDSIAVRYRLAGGRVVSVEVDELGLTSMPNCVLKAAKRLEVKDDGRDEVTVKYRIPA